MRSTRSSPFSFDSFALGWAIGDGNMWLGEVIQSLPILPSSSQFPILDKSARGGAMWSKLIRRKRSTLQHLLDLGGVGGNGLPPAAGLPKPVGPELDLERPR